MVVKKKVVRKKAATKTPALDPVGESAGTEPVTEAEALEIVQAGKPIGLMARLAKPQNVLAAAVEQITRVGTNKPKKDFYFRVHPEYFVDLISIQEKDSMEPVTYVLLGDVLDQALSEESITSVLLSRRYYLYVTQGGSYGLWGVSMPMDEGQDMNSWAESALNVIARAQVEWVRHYAKRGDGGYRIIPAGKDMGEPKWPAESWEKIVELAFKGKIVDSIDHAVLEKLRGNLQ